MGLYDDLIAKRDSVGLSHDEANELGQLMAEREGKPYGNAQNPPQEVIEEEGVAPEAETL